MLLLMKFWTINIYIYAFQKKTTAQTTHFKPFNSQLFTNNLAKLATIY